MKGKLDIRFFNKNKKTCEITVQNIGRIVLNAGEENNEKLPLGIGLDSYSLAQDSVKQFLKTSLGKDIDNVIFSPRSPELENYHEFGLVPAEPASLAQLLASSVLCDILAQAGGAVPEDNDKYDADCGPKVLNYLQTRYSEAFSKNRSEICRIFLSEKQGGGDNPVLNQAQHLFRQGRIPDCLEVLKTLDREKLSADLRGKYDELLFSATLKERSSDKDVPANEKLYNQLRGQNIFQNSTRLNLHFIWLRYLQDMRGRDSRNKLEKAQRILGNEFPLSALSPEQLCTKKYLAGRAEYYGGEYIGALDDLQKAYKLCSRDDPEMISDILNTAASCFTDNLFFEEADALHDKALELRRSLKLDKQWETVSAMGVTALKRRDFHRAAELFRQVCEAKGKDNRICNYLGKAEMFCGDRKTAETHLNEALELAKKESDEAFSYVNLMALYTEEGDYDRVIEIFKKSILLPEYREVLFQAGWGYRFAANAEYFLGSENDAIHYLARSVRCFTEDRFFLEAALSCLLPQTWDMDQEEIKAFYELVSDIPVYDNWRDLLEKHANLPDEYFSDLFKSCTNEKRLEKLSVLINKANRTAGDNQEDVQKALNYVCLL